MSKVWGIVGWINSGKDTVAERLVNHYGFQRLSFAGPLKDAVSDIFGWDRNLLEGNTPASRRWRETRDEWWSRRLDNPLLTPRWVLQNWGTEVLRRGFHEDIWVASLENKLRKTDDDVVISDCRFPNEIRAIRKQGGYVIRVTRGPEPEWYDAAVSVNLGPNGNATWSLSKQKLERLKIHASETSWVGYKFDAVITNNGTLDELYQQVKDLAQDHLVAKEDHSV